MSFFHSLNRLENSDMKNFKYILCLTFCLIWLNFTGSAQPDAAKAGLPPTPVKLSVLPAGVHRQTVSMPSGESVRYTISVPANLNRKKPVPLIIALHYGYPEKKTPFWGGEFLNDLPKPAFDDFNAVIVAPDSLQSGVWTTPANEEAVGWLTQSVMKSYPIDRRKVLISGFSMGARGTWFIGGRLQNLFTAAIIVAGKPPTGETDVKWKIPLYVIHSKKDNVFPLELTQKYVEKIKAAGANVELVVLDDAQHHEIDKYVKPLKETEVWLKRVWKMKPQ